MMDDDADFFDAEEQLFEGAPSYTRSCTLSMCRARHCIISSCAQVKITRSSRNARIPTFYTGQLPATAAWCCGPLARMSASDHEQYRWILGSTHVPCCRAAFENDIPALIELLPSTPKKKAPLLDPHGNNVSTRSSCGSAMSLGHHCILQRTSTWLRTSTLR